MERRGLLMKGTETITVKRSVGDNYESIFSNSVFDDLEQDISELVANSSDAGASNADIQYHIEKDFLCVSDDGDGMDEEGLESFLRIGDSKKQFEEVDSKGRSILGNFGVAHLSIQGLSFAYILETTNNGCKYTHKEVFVRDLVEHLINQKKDYDHLSNSKKKLKLEEILTKIETEVITLRGIFGDHPLLKNIEKTHGAIEPYIHINKPDCDVPFEKEFVGGDQTGTSIKMTALKIAKGDYPLLDVADLVNKLRKDYSERLIDGNFEITVNDKKISPFKISAPKEYDFKKSFSSIGLIKVKVFYSDYERLPDPGFHLYVNEREIAGDAFNLTKMKLSVASRFHVKIYADGLRTKVKLFRRGITKNKMYGDIRDYVKSCVNHVEADNRILKRIKISKKVRSVFDKVTKRLNSFLGTDSIYIPSNGRQKDFSIQLADSSISGHEAKLDFEKRVFYINKNRQITYGSDKEILPKLEQLLLSYCVSAITSHHLSSNTPGLNQMQSTIKETEMQIEKDLIARNKAYTLGELLGGAMEITTPKDYNTLISDFRQYRTSELPPVTGRPETVFLRLEKTGVLKEKDGKSIKQLCALIEGKKTIYEFARERAKGKNENVKSSWAFQKTRALYRNIEILGAVDYLENLSKTDDPLYLIPDEFEEEFEKTYWSRKRGRKKTRTEDTKVMGSVDSIRYVRKRTRGVLNLTQPLLMELVKGRELKLVNISKDDENGGKGYQINELDKLIDYFIQNKALPVD